LTRLYASNNRVRSLDPLAACARLEVGRCRLTAPGVNA